MKRIDTKPLAVSGQPYEDNCWVEIYPAGKGKVQVKAFLYTDPNRWPALKTVIAHGTLKNMLKAAAEKIPAKLKGRVSVREITVNRLTDAQLATFQYEDTVDPRTDYSTMADLIADNIKNTVTASAEREQQAKTPDLGPWPNDYHYLAVSIPWPTHDIPAGHEESIRKAREALKEAFINWANVKHGVFIRLPESDAGQENRKNLPITERICREKADALAMAYIAAFPNDHVAGMQAFAADINNLHYQTRNAGKESAKIS